MKRHLLRGALALLVATGCGKNADQAAPATAATAASQDGPTMDRPTNKSAEPPASTEPEAKPEDAPPDKGYRGRRNRNESGEKSDEKSREETEGDDREESLDEDKQRVSGLLAPGPKVGKKSGGEADGGGGRFGKAETERGDMDADSVQDPDEGEAKNGVAQSLDGLDALALDTGKHALVGLPAATPSSPRPDPAPPAEPDANAPAAPPAVVAGNTRTVVTAKLPGYAGIVTLNDQSGRESKGDGKRDKDEPAKPSRKGEAQDGFWQQPTDAPAQPVRAPLGKAVAREQLKSEVTRAGDVTTVEKSIEGRDLKKTEDKRQADGSFELQLAAKEATKAKEKAALTWDWEQGKDSKNGDHGVRTQDVTVGWDDHARLQKPERFLPRHGYFENTYLGGSAAYLERLRRLDQALAGHGQPHRLALADSQGFDSPARSGLAVKARLDRRTFDKPGRVFLEVGLRGSDRHGWRKPPLETVLVVAPQVVGTAAMHEAIASLLRVLGAEDRLAVVLALPNGQASVLAELGRPKSLLGPLTRSVDHVTIAPAPSEAGLLTAVDRARQLLNAASEHRTTLPGTQSVILLVGEGTAVARQVAARAHAMTVDGIVTSVALATPSAAGRAGWWNVAESGYGNMNDAAVGQVEAAMRAEIESQARVVARLVRLNIKLGPGVEAIRILGSQLLDDAEKKRVKAREVATDTNLSRTLGIKADRGDDDDGLQVVVPYFYGGDTHSIVLELWVDKPGRVADVTVRYKDMVGLGNQTESVAVDFRSVPRPETEEQRALAQSLDGFRVAEALDHAARELARGQSGQARGRLNGLLAGALQPRDRTLVQGFARIVDTAPHASVAQALRLASQRRIGATR